MNDGVRCGNCGKKLAEALVGGLLVVRCRGCDRIVTIDNRFSLVLDKRIPVVLR